MSEPQPETVTTHMVLGDGYCSTCQTVPCRGARDRRPLSAQQQQMNRIESKLNRILRHLGLDEAS